MTCLLIADVESLKAEMNLGLFEAAYLTGKERQCRVNESGRWAFLQTY